MIVIFFNTTKTTRFLCILIGYFLKNCALKQTIMHANKNQLVTKKNNCCNLKKQLRNTKKRRFT
jgi:hypothetical protein